MERPFILLLDKSFEFNVQKKVCVHTLLSVGSVYPLLLQEQEVDAQKAADQNERRSRNNGPHIYGCQEKGYILKKRKGCILIQSKFCTSLGQKAMLLL
jgi:hypothetical protein